MLNAVKSLKYLINMERRQLIHLSACLDQMRIKRTENLNIFVLQLSQMQMQMSFQIMIHFRSPSFIHVTVAYYYCSIEKRNILTIFCPFLQYVDSFSVKFIFCFYVNNIFVCVFFFFCFSVFRFVGVFFHMRIISITTIFRFNKSFLCF